MTNIVALLVYLLFTQAFSDATITWTAPPPQRGPLQTSDLTVRRTTQQLVINSPEGRLKWEFTLSGETLDRVIWERGNNRIGRKTSSGVIVIEPTANFQEHFGVSSDDPATLIIKNVTEADAAVFRCSVETNVKTWADEIQVEIVAPPKLTNVSNDKPNHYVNEGSSLQLFCEAYGLPPPNITWTKVLQGGSESEVLHRGTSWNFVNITSSSTGTYRCKATNGIGSPASQLIGVIVFFAPKIKLQNEYYVGREKSMSLHCQVEGYPPPAIIWTPTPQENVCDKSSLKISKVQRDAVYNCAAKNDLGNASASTSLIIGAKKINLTLSITTETCIEGDTSFWDKLQKAVDIIFSNKNGYVDATLLDKRCGSLIVDLALKFTSVISEAWVLSTLRSGIIDGKLGELAVNASSIVGIPVIESTATPPTGKTTTKPSDVAVEECRRCSCNCTILIAVSTIFAAIIILLIVYIIWLHKKGTTERGRSYAESTTKRTAIEMEVREPDRQQSRQQTSEVCSRSQYMALDDARRSNGLPEVSPTSDTSQTSQYAPLHPSTLSGEIPRENVTIEKIIGKGAFGQVAKGTVIGLRGRPQKTLVAVKMLKANAPESDRKDLLSELEVMKTLKPHPHVIKLLGCITESEPLLVLIEYVPYGDLLGYLRKSRGLNDTYYKGPDIKPQTSLTSQQLMKFAWQIADGMSYLSSRSIIHRDLAARNVLVGENETCKVTDFGMARDVKQESIYERKTKGRLPVKWTAYESLMYGTYTTKSDVWSYGILLYEIFTIGGSPYPRMDGRKIASLLQQGYRMPKPQHVDDELYKIMTTCWEEDPNVRPAFAELRNKLKRMENQHKRLINMKMYDTQLYANVEDLVV